jgi:hypothetical protein
MKTRNFRNIFMTSLAALAITGTMVISSCDKEDDDDIKNPKAKYNLSGTAGADQEVPATTSAGTATLTGTYDTLSKQLMYSITWTGLTGDVTVAHFHGPAAAGETATPLQDIPLVTNGASGSTADTITASSDLHSALLAGKVYYNLHTATYPDGEIRAQVNLSPQ